MQNIPSENEIKEVYAWVNQIPLSKVKKNISRDFADGVFVAEILFHYFPRLVQLHNYSPASAKTKKRYNWDTLNRKILSKIDAVIDDETIEEITNATPGVIDVFLVNLLSMIKKTHALNQSKAPFHGKKTSGDNRKGMYRLPSVGESNDKIKCSSTSCVSVYDSSNENKKSEVKVGSKHDDCKLVIDELNETIGLLQLKVSKLEQLIKVKNATIKKLQSSIQEHSP